MRSKRSEGVSVKVYLWAFTGLNMDVVVYIDG